MKFPIEMFWILIARDLKYDFVNSDNGHVGGQNKKNPI